MDDLCFGFINFLHSRHPLPDNFGQMVSDYVRQWDQATPEDYFAVDPAALALGLQGLQTGQGQPCRATFPSPLRLGVEPNDQAVFDLYPCSQGWTAPTMIIAHGLMSVNDVGYQLWAQALNKRGWNTIFAQLPFHYNRCPKGRFSGEMAIGTDILRSVEGARQSVKEMRIVLHWLKDQGCPLVGAWGISYGGWITGMLGCVDDRLERMILLEPVLNIHHAVWYSPATVSLRAGLVSRGVRKESLEGHMRLCCPSFMELKVQARHVILVAGEYDRITPVEEVARLHQHWRGSHFHVSSQGHVGHQMMPKSLQMAEELWPDDFRETQR